MSHILVDTANTFFRARHVFRGDTSEKNRTIGNEQGLGDVAGGYVQINRRNDGKTEVS